MTQSTVQNLMDSYEEKFKLRTPNSRRPFEAAREHLLGGVGGNAKFMRPHPVYFKSAKGCRLRDVDNNEYINTIMGAGSQILGHNAKPVVDAIRTQLDSSLTIVFATELELKLAEKIQKFYPHMELLRYSNTHGNQGSQGLHRKGHHRQVRREPARAV